MFPSKKNLRDYSPCAEHFRGICAFLRTCMRACVLLFLLTQAMLFFMKCGLGPGASLSFQELVSRRFARCRFQRAARGKGVGRPSSFNPEVYDVFHVQVLGPPASARLLDSGVNQGLGRNCMLWKARNRQWHTQKGSHFARVRLHEMPRLPNVLLQASTRPCSSTLTEDV